MVACYKIAKNYQGARKNFNVATSAEFRTNRPATSVTDHLFQGLHRAIFTKESVPMLILLNRRKLPPNTTTQTITQLYVLEISDETFMANLTKPSNVSIGDAQGLGIITDDDLPLHRHWQGDL